MTALLLAACRPGEALVATLRAEVAPSEHVEPAFAVSWAGPAGEATLWAIEADVLPRGSRGDLPDGPPWRAVAVDAVREGRSTLPLALFPAGAEVHFRVSVATADALEWSQLGTVTVPDAPELLQDTDVDDGSAALGGWLVAHRYAPQGHAEETLAAVLDDRGRPVWWYAPPEGLRVLRALPSADLRSVLVQLDREGDGDEIRRVALGGGAETVTPTGDATHDFRESADGTLTWLAYEERPAGTIRGNPYPVVADALVQGPEGGGGTERLYSFFDDYPLEPWQPCGHARVGNFVPGKVEWTHTNTVIRSPDDDGWILLARQLDALVFVEDPVAPGVSGARRWQLGGRAQTLTPDGPDDLFDHGHASQAWREDDGLHVLVFDNRVHHPRPGVSRVAEYLVEPERGRYHVISSLWDPEDRMTAFLGDARRLPGGETLVTWTPHEEIVAYDPDGAPVWTLTDALPWGRTTWVPELRP